MLDAHGRPLAVSADVDSIWANPHEVRDLAATAETLATLIGIEASVLEGKLAGDHRFVWLARHVEADVAKHVRAAKLPGIEVAQGAAALVSGARRSRGPVIGRADIDGKGLDGIELAMNDMLAGKRTAVERAARCARPRDARRRPRTAPSPARPCSCRSTAASRRSPSRRSPKR